MILTIYTIPTIYIILMIYMLITILTIYMIITVLIVLIIDKKRKNSDLLKDSFFTFFWETDERYFYLRDIFRKVWFLKKISKKKGSDL